MNKNESSVNTADQSALSADFPVLQALESREARPYCHQSQLGRLGVRLLKHEIPRDLGEEQVLHGAEEEAPTLSAVRTGVSHGLSEHNKIDVCEDKKGKAERYQSRIRSGGREVRGDEVKEG